MPRVTYVQRAQQRYRTVPVLDPVTGKQKVTPVMQDGRQKTTKTGRPVFRGVSVEDRAQPLPLQVCDYCRQPIEVGTPYN